MCLLFHKNNRIRVATKDIVVYKLLQYKGINNVDCTLLISPFKYMEWKLNKKYKTKITILKKMSSSFDTYDRMYAEIKWGYNNIWSAKRGFHSSKTKERIFKYTGRYNDVHVIYKAIIPKGSKYITGIDGLMVSDQLIIIEEAK